jgi:hypothetical protein
VVISESVSADACDPGLGLLMSRRQSGLTSAPMSPEAVQTMRGPSDRMTVSSGSQSASISAEWLHQMVSQ